MTAPRACVLSVSGPVLLAEEAALIREVDPWGVILMGRSCETPEQVRALVGAIHGASGRETLTFIDQEGGRVRRLRPPAWPDFPAAAAYGRLWRLDRDAGVEAARLGHRLIAHELAALGVRADCAPVLDLLHPEGHGVIGDRAFGSEPEAVAALGRAALDGLAAGGVVGAIKHMPGHGRATADSHERLPVVDAAADQLARDLAPFAALADAPVGITAHVAYSAWDAAPATHSARVVADVIRGRIGFSGLLMTDDLGMQALGGALAERCARALAAGCEMMLHCAGFARDAAVVLAEMREVADASPELAGPALARALAAEAATGHAMPFDPDEAWSRLRALLARAEPGVA